ncbi:hypothetical protein HD554DRAFT_2298897 [Boletus coccyginus]|nr:hypothetical protein HD554DRAFT_2298897 [Boletus coccyginus]
MALSHENEHSHPYWYAHIIHMDLLFVHWFHQDVNYSSGWSKKHLLRLQFFNQDIPSNAFGFLDPDLVVYGMHLILALAYGHTEELLGHSYAHQQKDAEDWASDWKYYYVNMFVDCNIFMRFWGGGIGHKVMYDWNSFLHEDLGKAVDEDDKDSASNDLEDKRGVEKHEELEERMDKEKNGAITEEEEEWREWKQVMKDIKDEDNNSNGDGDSNSDKSDLAQEDKMDHVVADDREELQWLKKLSACLHIFT